MSVLKLSLLVDLQHRAGEIILYATSCPSITILENNFNWCFENVVMVTLTTGIIFIPFICMHFGCGEYYEICVGHVCDHRL
jgi:hypothetical protein